jgi:hypothetical protein
MSGVVSSGQPSPGRQVSGEILHLEEKWISGATNLLIDGKISANLVVFRKGCDIFDELSLEVESFDG